MNWQQARHVSFQFASFWYTSKVKSQSRMKLGHENGDSWRSFLQNSENNSKQTALVRKVIQNSRKSYHNIITAVHSLFEHKSFAIIPKLPLKLNANPCSSRLVGFMKAGSLRPRGAFSDKTILQRCFNSASTHRVSRIMKIYQSKLWVCLQNKFAFFFWWKNSGKWTKRQRRREKFFHYRNVFHRVGWWLVEMWAMRLKTSISAIKIQQPASNWSFYVCFNFVTGFPMHEMALRVVASLIFEVLNFVIADFNSIFA